MEKEEVHIHCGKLLSNQKNEIMPFTATWMDLEIIILIEVCQKKERQLPDITYMWNPKYVTSGPTYKAETDSQMIHCFPTYFP